jgi:hypothetical protein
VPNKKNRDLNGIADPEKGRGLGLNGGGAEGGQNPLPRLRHQEDHERLRGCKNRAKLPGPVPQRSVRSKTKLNRPPAMRHGTASSEADPPLMASAARKTGRPICDCGARRERLAHLVYAHLANANSAGLNRDKYSLLPRFSALPVCPVAKGLAA